MSLVGYLSVFSQGLEQENGDLLASLLSIHHPTKDLLQYKSEAKVQQFIPSPWTDVVMHHIRVQNELLQDNLIQANEYQTSLVHSFLSFFSQLGRWSLPVLLVLNKDLRNLAMKVRNSFALYLIDVVHRLTPS